MDSTFLQDRITATKARIVAYETAALSLASGAIQSYNIDTGQTRQTVTKLNITELHNLINGLYNQLAVLEARLTGNGTTIGVPRW